MLLIFAICETLPAAFALLALIFPLSVQVHNYSKVKQPKMKTSRSQQSQIMDFLFYI